MTEDSNRDVLTVEAMHEVDRRWSAADSAAGRTAFYAEGAMLDNVNGQPDIGIGAIRAHYESIGPIEAGVLTFDEREAAVLGDWGYTSGVWTERSRDGFNQGHFLHVMKLVNGELKIIRHIYDSCDGGCPD